MPAPAADLKTPGSAAERAALWRTPGDLKIHQKIIEFSTRILVPFWVHFGLILASFWHHFGVEFRIDFRGTFMVTFLAIRRSIWAPFWHPKPLPGTPRREKVDPRF